MTSTPYTVFARRYRPAAFDDVAGQEHVATTLKNAIEQNRVGHAYLFSGPRGVGKTSMARVFAKALNCAKGPTSSPCGECETCRQVHEGQDADVIEMDAASNRGVDDARALREGLRYTPLRGRFKIYIIDEAHMLTREAFNTLLKVLEEPPPHVKFIFATTEPQRLPDTILSRCQRFDFRRVTSRDITKRLQQIVKREKVGVADDALTAIARASGGSMRDSQSLLDQIVAYSTRDVKRTDVEVLLGHASSTDLYALLDAVSSADARTALQTLDRLFQKGIDVPAFTSQLLDHVRHLLLLRACGKDADFIDLPDAEREDAAAQSTKFSLEALLYIIQLLLESQRRQREGADARLLLEVTLLKLTRIGDLISLSQALQATEGTSPMPLPAPRAAIPAPPKPAAPAPTRPVQTVEREPDDSSVPVASDLASIRSRWPGVVETAKAKNLLVGTLLSQGSVTGAGGDEIEFTFPPQFTRFHADQIELPRNRAIVEEAIQKTYGRSFTLAIKLQRGSPEGAPAAPVEAPKPATPEFAADPAVRTILSTFPGSKIVGIQ